MIHLLYLFLSHSIWREPKNNYFKGGDYITKHACHEAQIHISYIFEYQQYNLIDFQGILSNQLINVPHNHKISQEVLHTCYCCV